MATNKTPLDLKKPNEWVTAILSVTEWAIMDAKQGKRRATRDELMERLRSHYDVATVRLMHVIKLRQVYGATYDVITMELEISRDAERKGI